MRTASHWPLTILWQICIICCTKLRKHFNAIVEVFYCFTVRLAWRCIRLHWRQKFFTYSAHAKQGGCRVRQQWEQGVRFWLFWPHWSRCHKIEMMQCALLYCDLWKQKLQHAAFLLPTLAPHPTELSKVFQVGCFNFAQMKASAELCTNKLSDAAAKSELKANCEIFDSELGWLRTLDGLADSCMSSGMSFWKGTESLANWLSPYTKRKTGVNEATIATSLCLISLEECMPRCHENNWTKAGWYPVRFSSLP